MSQIEHITTDEGLRRVSQEVAKLGALPAGWDGYGARAPAENIRTRAINFLAHLDWNGLREPAIGPKSNGGIQVDWRRGQRELELHVEPNDRVDFLKVENDQP